MEHIDTPTAALALRTLADAVASGTAPVPLMRRDESEGYRMRIIPRLLHNVLCDWRIGTGQDTDPVVLACAGCGLCYPPESVDPTGTTTTGRALAPTGPPPLPAPRNLAAELVPRGDGWHVSPCTTPACQRPPVPGLLVCCIPCRSAPEGKHGPHTEVCDRRWAASVTAGPL